MLRGMTPSPKVELREPGDESNCLAFKIRQAARAISQRYDTALAPHGLTSPQFNLLGILAHAGLRSLSQIANTSTTDRTTLNRSMGLLERMELVESAAGRDKRTRRFMLTAKGRKLHSAARADWLEVQQTVHGEISRSRFDRLHADLDVLLQRVRPSED